MNISIFSCFVALASALLLQAAAPVVVSADDDPHRITARLPGAYQGSRVLRNADRIEFNVLRPATSVGPFDEIQYVVAVYADRDQAAADFDSLFPQGHVSHGSWHVALQSRSSVHWLRGNCEIADHRFRELYAGAVGYVSAGGETVESAWLCECGSNCRRVAVDR